VTETDQVLSHETEEKKGKHITGLFGVRTRKPGNPLGREGKFQKLMGARKKGDTKWNTTPSVGRAAQATISSESVYWRRGEIWTGMQQKLMVLGREKKKLQQGASAIKKEKVKKGVPCYRGKGINYRGP